MDTTATTQNGRNPGRTLKIPWFLSNKIYTNIHQQDCYGNDNPRKFCWSLEGKKFIENKGCSYRKTWTTWKWLEWTRIWLPRGWNSLKNVDLDEPTYFISWSRFFWDVLNVNANWMKSFFEEYTKMFESRISAGATDKLPWWAKPHAKTVARSCDMEGHDRKCVERYRE